MKETTVWEKLGVLDAKLSAAHKRIDDLEKGIGEDLKEIKADVKALNAYMNRGKGWAAAVILLAGSAGALVVKLIAIFKL